jgi:hypothetical protein
MTSQRRSSRSILDQMELIAGEQSNSNPNDATEEDLDYATDNFDTQSSNDLDIHVPLDDSLHNLFETLMEDEDKDLAVDMEYGAAPRRLSASAPMLGSRDRVARPIQMVDGVYRRSHASSDDSPRRQSFMVSPRRVTTTSPSLEQNTRDSKSLIGRVRNSTFLNLLNQSKRSVSSSRRSKSSITLGSMTQHPSSLLRPQSSLHLCSKGALSSSDKVTMFSLR